MSFDRKGLSLSWRFVNIDQFAFQVNIYSRQKIVIVYKELVSILKSINKIWNAFFTVDVYNDALTVVFIIFKVAHFNWISGIYFYNSAIFEAIVSPDFSLEKMILFSLTFWNFCPFYEFRICWFIAITWWFWEIDFTKIPEWFHEPLITGQSYTNVVILFEHAFKPI